MPDDSGFDYEAALAACANGNRQALHQLYDQESARLLGVARRIVHDAGLAEDVVHDAFLTIWKRAGSFDPAKGAARGWIYTVTRHLALNAVRDSARDVDLSPDSAVAIDARLSLDAWQQASENLHALGHPERLGECLGQLEPERRHCLVHAYVDGLSHQEIAQQMNTPLGTIKAWIRRSLRALKECLA